MTSANTRPISSDLPVRKPRKNYNIEEVVIMELID